MTTRYGYIGLGMMGSAMAENLIGTGARVSVFDLDTTAVETAVSQGGAAGSGPAEVASNSDIVSICVPAAEHIHAVLADMAPGAHSDLKILIHSTVSPETITQAAATAAQWGVPLFDACVAGGVTNAVVGTQTVLAGGIDDMPADVLALLDIYADKIITAGPVGSGAALKVAVNVMTYAQFAAATASHDLMTSSGANPEALFDAWRHMGQMGALTEHFRPLLGIPAEHVAGDFLTGMLTQVGIARKDLSLVQELGGTRDGLSAVVQAIHDAMPAIYNVASHVD